MKGLICALFILACIALPAVINLVHLSVGKELTLFQHFRSTVTIFECLGKDNKCLETLGENAFV